MADFAFVVRSWQDAWSGATVTGPKNISVSQPVEKIPLWHKTGGLTILASEPTLRVDDQDWSELTLEAFPHVDAEEETVTRRTLVDRGPESPRTTATMRTDIEAKELHFAITEAEDSAERAWVLRIHLAPGQRVGQALLDGTELDAVHLSPVAEPEAHLFTPFGGKGARGAPHEGHVAELHLPSAAAARSVHVKLE